MSLTFPSNISVGDVHDPGNGNRYVWDGDQWNQVEKELKRTLPIDINRDTDDEIYHLIDLTLLTNI